MNGKQLAQALGLSPSMISKLRKRGMPMGSVDAAQRWRKRHLLTTMTKGVRAGSSLSDLPPPAARPSVATALGPASSQAREALPQGHELQLPGLPDDQAMESFLPTLAVMTGDEAMRQVELLGEFAAQLLAQGRFGEIRTALQAAMRAVPPARRPEFLLAVPDEDERFTEVHLPDAGAPVIPIAVFEELTRPVVEVLAEFGALLDDDHPPQTDAELEWSAAFLFSVAAGEVRIVAS